MVWIMSVVVGATVTRRVARHLCTHRGRCQSEQDEPVPLVERGASHSTTSPKVLVSFSLYVAYADRPCTRSIAACRRSSIARAVRCCICCVSVGAVCDGGGVRCCGVCCSGMVFWGDEKSSCSVALRMQTLCCTLSPSVHGTNPRTTPQEIFCNQQPACFTAAFGSKAPHTALVPEQQRAMPVRIVVKPTAGGNKIDKEVEPEWTIQEVKQALAEQVSAGSSI